MDFDKIYNDTLEEINERFNNGKGNTELAKIISIASAQTTLIILKKYHEQLLQENR